MIKTWNVIILWGISRARTKRGGWGEGRWPGLTLKITSSIGNKQLSSTPTPGKCWTPFGTKKYSFLQVTIEPSVNKFRTLNLLQISLRTKKLTKPFFVRFCSASPPAPPPPPLRRKLLDPLMSDMLFSELKEYNKGMSMMSNMLGVSIKWNFSEIKQPVFVENCFQLSVKSQSLQEYIN